MRYTKRRNMKKSLVAIVALGVTLATQAASFGWKTANYSQFVDPTSGAAITTAADFSSALAGGSIVLVYLADGTYSSAQLLETYDTGATTGTGSAAFKASGAATQKFGIAGTYATDGSKTKLKDGDVIGVMYMNADGALSQLLYADTKEAINSTYTIVGLDGADPKDGWSGGTFTIGTAGTSSARTEFTVAVPEPTSGLLLLLGMAGLALRRKQA
jgi:hypothetical protein